MKPGEYVSKRIVFRERTAPTLPLREGIIIQHTRMSVQINLDRSSLVLWYFWRDLMYDILED
jgi:hypothetical protein